MTRQKSQARQFNGMRYAEVQRRNSEQRQRLKPADQLWLKQNGYKNVGWDQVIALHQKIEEFLEKAQFEDMSLEELFLEADRIGNKYLSPAEIEAFNRQFSEEVAEIEELVDQYFPDTEIETIDFSQKAAPKSHRKSSRKPYPAKLK
jgi:phosphatidate phosphatase PAH1